ncbi:MAG TPA: oligosaccharide flippase family protein [candidate division Zixibacteria bacterium]|nr:oligosaccharide flippase family protein [candidate division Zixibacteria bacterium]
MAQGDLLEAAKGGGAVFAGRLFAWGSRFVLGVLLARLLGSEEYGLYNTALSLAAIATSFAVVGLDAALVRYASIFSARDDEPGLRGAMQFGVALPAVLGAMIALGIFISADLVASRLFDVPELAPLLRVIALMVPAMVVAHQLAAVLQGLKRIQYGVLAQQVIQPMARFLILLVMALIGMTAERAVIASTLATIVVAGLLLALVGRFVPLRRPLSAGRRETGLLLRFSLPVYFSNVVTSLGDHLQAPLLGAMSSMASAGVFAVSNQINLVGSIFHQAVTSSSMPLFAEMHDRGDRGGLEHLYRTTSKWTLSLNLPFFLIATIFPQALLAIFGEEFEAGTAALTILAWANLVNAATGTSGAVLDMTGYTGVKFVNSTVSVGLGLGLNLLLIPPLGVEGAAIATLVTIGSVNLLRLAEVLLLIRVHPYSAEYLKPLGAGLGSALAGLAVLSLTASHEPLLQGAVGLPVVGLVYAGLLVRFGLTDDDHVILSRVRARFRRRGASRAAARRSAAETSEPRSVR